MRLFNKCFAAAAVGLLIVITTAKADEGLSADNVGGFLSGNDLHEKCLQSRNPHHRWHMWSSGMLYGFVSGQVDGVYIVEYGKPLDERVVLPAGVSVRSITELLCDFISENPEKRHLHSGVLFWTAMDEAYDVAPKGAGWAEIPASEWKF